MDLRDPATLESISNSIIRPSASKPVKKLYKGEPMALGITQILIGILEIAFGLVVALGEHDGHLGSDSHIVTPYWMGILYIISGSLSVAVAKELKKPLVKGMLAMNVVSSVAAGIAIVIFSVSVSYPGNDYICSGYYYRNIPSEICHEYFIIPEMQKHSISVVLLTFTILEFFITITTAAFGCASLCQNVYSETTVVIFQNISQETPPAFLTPVKKDEAL